MTILYQHQTVGEVTQGSDNLFLVPCTTNNLLLVPCTTDNLLLVPCTTDNLLLVPALAKLVCSLLCIAILLSVHEVFPYDNVWICIGAYHITQKTSQVGEFLVSNLLPTVSKLCVQMA